ncbi:response regulator [Microcoleus sp. F8-D3]
MARLCILAVDDEIDNLDLVQFIWDQAGATAISLSSATDALQQLTKFKPDVLIADIGMPKIDGYMLIRQVRQLSTEDGGKIRAIALTAYAGETNQQQALAAGFQRHLPKPVDPETLVETIEQLLDPIGVSRALNIFANKASATSVQGFQIDYWRCLLSIVWENVMNGSDRQTHSSGG